MNGDILMWNPDSERSL
ncbi:MAG: hypothetical protein ACLU38_03945 [Dysosmobacter sp.]